MAPVPVASGADDFGYLFLADTIRHFRLANPALPWPRFFEQTFVLQEPARAAMFPLGQGLVLIFGWLGLVIVIGVFCASTYWMLRGWVLPQWALVGGLLAVCEFGPLCYWMNCYWGGVLSPVAGCLVFGALPRLVTKSGWRDAVLLGIGFALQALTRQYEFLLLLLAALTWLVRVRPKCLAVAALCVAPALLLIAAQNRAITGSVTQFPYLLYRDQYGVPATFTFEANATPHGKLNQQQELDYRTESAVHGNGSDSAVRFAQRLWERVRFYRFFLYAPLLVAGLFGVWGASWRVLIAIAIFVVGSNFYPYFYPHYIGAITCLFLLLALQGLEKGKPAYALAVVMACGLQFIFWYGVRAAGEERLAAYESWDFVNGRDPQGRATIDAELARQPGKELVFVHLSPVHRLTEWVHNDVDLSASPVVYAHDLGDGENRTLMKAFPERTVWLLEPDETPPRLTRYTPSASPFEDVR